MKMTDYFYYFWKTRTETKEDSEQNVGLAARELILCFSSADEPNGFPTDTLKWAPWSLCLERQQILCCKSSSGFITSRKKKGSK